MSWNIELPDPEWYTADDPRLPGVANEVLNEEVVAIDTETTGLRIFPGGDSVLFWSLAWAERRVCMPVDTLPFFYEAFQQPVRRWVLANAKFDMHMLANSGAPPFEGNCVDVAVMHALLYEEDSHSLKDMAKQVLGWRWTDFFDTFERQMVLDTSEKGLAKSRVLRNGQRSVVRRPETIQEMLMRASRENLEVLVDYASNDAYGTLKLYEELNARLEREKTFSLYPDKFETLADLFYLTEVPFTKVLWKCERNGIFINQEYLKSLRGPMQAEVTALERKAVELSGDANFNINSVPDLRKYFVDVKGLKPLMYTKGGKSGVKLASIDKGFLEHYEHDDELAAVVLRYRKLTKLISTYIDSVHEFTDVSSRIHTRFNQDVARTGRLSSSDPNLQNIPNAEKDKFQLRGAFQATPGKTLIVGDYSQLEMRLLACATVTKENPQGARDMIQIFLDGKDIHMGNAAMVFGPIYEKNYGWKLTYDFLKEAKKIDGQVKDGKLPPEARTERHELALFARNAIKSVGFGLNYGMREGKLGRQLNITKEAAKAIIDAYMGTYPAVQEFYDAAIAETEATGYSFTLLGRRRFHPGILSYNKMDRLSEQRKAVNNNIQGTAADAVRLAMIRIDEARLDRKYGCNMLLQIHDELVFECPEETADAALTEIKNIMEHPFPTDLIVPLDVSIGKGQSWNKAK